MKVANRHSGKIGIATFVTILLSYIIAFSNTINKFSSELLHSVEDNNMNVPIAERLNIACFIAEGHWQRFSVLSTIVMFSVFIIAILLGMWVSDTLEIEETSYLLFTEESCKIKDKTEKKQRRQWGMFIISVITSVFCGVLSNYIFQFLLN